jgi:RNA polymerase sigma-70 factor (ECF subfamily)
VGVASAGYSRPPASRITVIRKFATFVETGAVNYARLADEELMQAVQAGDPMAFETIYDRHGGAAFSLAYRIVGTRSAAEDATQDAFLAIWRSRVRYQRDRGSVRSWILGIVHNRTIDALRRNQVHATRRADAEGIEEREAAAELTDVEAFRREEQRRVRAAIETLPEAQVKVIELAYFGGFTHNQIAEMLHEPVGTVKGRMRLGLDKLRRELAGAMA